MAGSWGRQVPLTQTTPGSLVICELVQDTCRDTGRKSCVSSLWGYLYWQDGARLSQERGGEERVEGPGKRWILVSITYMEEFRQLPRSETKPPTLLLSKHAGHFSLYFESGKLFFLLLIRIALTNNLPIPLRAGKYRHVSMSLMRHLPSSSCCWPLPLLR